MCPGGEKHLKADPNPPALSCPSSLWCCKLPTEAVVGMTHKRCFPWLPTVLFSQLFSCLSNLMMAFPKMRRNCFILRIHYQNQILDAVNYLGFFFLNPCLAPQKPYLLSFWFRASVTSGNIPISNVLLGPGKEEEPSGLTLVNICALLTHFIFLFVWDRYCWVMKQIGKHQGVEFG